MWTSGSGLSPCLAAVPRVSQADTASTGEFVVASILDRDFPLMPAGVLVFAVIFVVINVLVDVPYTIVAPRVRLASSCSVISRLKGVKYGIPQRFQICGNTG